MRFDKLTIKGQEALQEAQGQCSARGHQNLEAAHLLFALLGQPEGSTLPILQKLGVPVDGLRGEVEKVLKQIPKVTGGAAQPDDAGSLVVVGTTVVAATVVGETVGKERTGRAMGLLGTVHTKGGKLPRQLYFLAALLRHPLMALRSSLWPFGWSKGMAGVLAMQSVDNSMELHYKRSLLSPFSKSLASDWGDRPKPPTYLPEANEVTARLAQAPG